MLVDLLSPFMDADSKIISSDEKNSTGPQIQAGVYLWIAPTSMLEPALWTFEEFMRDKAHMWIGNGANDAEYMEVDRRRQMEGKIVSKAFFATLCLLLSCSHTLRLGRTTGPDLTPDPQAHKWHTPSLWSFNQTEGVQLGARLHQSEPWRPRGRAEASDEGETGLARWVPWCRRDIVHAA